MISFEMLGKFKTFETIQNSENQALQAMNSAKQSVEFIKTQLVAMSTNPEYSPDECAQVQAVLAGLVEVAKSLIPNE